MEKVKSKKARELLEPLNNRLTVFEIRKGSLDARFPKNCYFIFKVVENGFACPGLYGVLVAYGKTYTELLKSFNE